MICGIFHSVRPPEQIVGPGFYLILIISSGHLVRSRLNVLRDRCRNIWVFIARIPNFLRRRIVPDIEREESRRWS